MKQTTEKIIAAAEERGWINENEILLLKRRRNRGERIQIENPIPVSTIYCHPRPIPKSMNTKSFSEVANKVMARIERVARYEGVVTEILSRVLGDEDIPTPCIEVDTDENVNLVYELKEAPKTSRITILAAVFPSMTNKGGNKLKIYYDDIF